MTTDGRYKVPNLEVMTDWARWVIGDVEFCDNILKTGVEGPISDLEAKWPKFMQQSLDPRLVTKTRGAISCKTSEKSITFYFLALCNPLERKDGKSPSKLELVAATSTSVFSINPSAKLS